VFLLSRLAFQTVDKPWPLPSGGKEESVGLSGEQHKVSLGTGGESLHG